MREGQETREARQPRVRSSDISFAAVTPRLQQDTVQNNAGNGEEQRGAQGVAQCRPAAMTVAPSPLPWGLHAPPHVRIATAARLYGPQKSRSGGSGHSFLLILTQSYGCLRDHQSYLYKGPLPCEP